MSRHSHHSDSTMVKFSLFGTALAAGALLIGSSPLFAHGGTYRGPGDTVPPPAGTPNGGTAPPPPVNGGPGRPVTPGGPPGTPAPGAPVTPGRTPSRPGQQGPAVTGGGQLGPDVSIWDFWWGFNKEPYQNLRNKVRAGGVESGGDEFYIGKGTQFKKLKSLRPTPNQVEDLVVPALKWALDNEEQNDIVTGALIALGKIGDTNEEDGTSEFVEIISGFLPAAEQEIQETAALALGILAHDRSVPALVGLMGNTDKGRKLIQEASDVPFRTRAFAAYGLGLVGYQTPTNEMRQVIDEHLIDVLQSPRGAQPDTRVGALLSLGLVPLAWDSDLQVDEGDASNAMYVKNRKELLRYLSMKMHPRDRGAKGAFEDRRVRAQTPITVGRLLSKGDFPEGDAEAVELRTELVDQLIKLATARSDDVSIRQSATIALGMIASAGGDGAQGKLNRTILRQLETISKTAADNQTEFFAVMAIAQMGSSPGSGEEPRALQGDCEEHLLEALGNGKGQKAPWAGLSLGVYGNALLDNGGNLSPKIAESLRLRFTRSKSSFDRGAYAIALGLIEDLNSAPVLMETLDKLGTGQDDVRGYICVGLGLMGAAQATEQLTEIVTASKFRPELLKQAAIGLGLLGDKSAVELLLGMFESAKGLASQAAIASALGTIGDVNAVEGLVDMVRGETETPMSDVARGFACAALGITCDKEPLPWNTKISVNVNYRANVRTLTSPDTGDGILDIL